MKTLILLLLVSCASTKTDYPKHWWKEVPKKELAWWEIGPQAAKSGEVILSKRNELGVLSNFADTPFTFEGKKYATVEGLWQSLLYPESVKDPRFKHGKWKHKRSEVAKMQGFPAKMAGDAAEKVMKKMKIDWVTYKGKRMTYWTKEKGEHYKLIRAAMMAKLNQNPKVKKVLLSTKGLKLMPDHITSPDDPPAWKYNIIWMEIRDSLLK